MHTHVGDRDCKGAWEMRGGGRGAHFWGNLRQRERMASTTTILKSSAMSLMKEPICLSRRSTLLSLPVLSSVVMASVAIVRLESLISASRSRLVAATAPGCVIATWRTRQRGSVSSAPSANKETTAHKQ